MLTDLKRKCLDSLQYLFFGFSVIMQIVFYMLLFFSLKESETEVLEQCLKFNFMKNEILGIDYSVPGNNTLDY